MEKELTDAELLEWYAAHPQYIDWKLEQPKGNDYKVVVWYWGIGSFSKAFTFRSAVTAAMAALQGS